MPICLKILENNLTIYATLTMPNRNARSQSVMNYSFLNIFRNKNEKMAVWKTRRRKALCKTYIKTVK